MNESNTKLSRALPIRVDEVYTLAEFQRRTGLGRNGMRTARKRGLPISQCGRNKYVAGADWAEFLRRGGKPSPSDR